MRLTGFHTSLRGAIAAVAAAVMVAAVAGCDPPNPPRVAVAGEQTATGDDAVEQDQLQLTDIHGRRQQPFDDPQTTAVVLVFVLQDCPIANSYIPELNRLHADYEPRGIQLLLVQVDAQASIEDLRKHAQEYRVEFPVVWDERHAWVQTTGATITPEASVLSPGGELLYRGRIDDRHVAFGKRPEATTHDLRDALDAILAGRPIAQPRTQAVGCFILNVAPEK